MQQAALIIGAILVLCFAFYVGRKFDYWRYVLMTENEAEVDGDKTVDKFPNSSAGELLEQALAAERRGDSHDAVVTLHCRQAQESGVSRNTFSCGPAGL